MRKTWMIEQRVRGQNQRAKKVGARHDLTVEQWLETSCCIAKTAGIN